MARKSLATNLKLTRLMTEALKARGSELPAGITQELITELDKLNNKATSNEVEQSKLRALLKEKSAQQEKTIQSLEEKYIFMKKYIKIGIPQELWREFGIEDKK